MVIYQSKISKGTVKDMRYTKNILLKHLKIFEKEKGRPPKAGEFVNNPRFPSYRTYERFFGSWNNSLKEAGFDQRIGGTELYTKDELLEYIFRFYTENGRPPVAADFCKHSKYPSCGTYQKRFGSWDNALKLVGLDIDSMVKFGVLSTTTQKARSFELQVIKYLGDRAIDLSGQNPGSYFDGVCPKGESYDAKAGKLNCKGGYEYWHFGGMDKDIGYYFLGLFGYDFKELLFVLRIPSFDCIELLSGEYLNIGRKKLDNLKEYDITGEFKEGIK